MNSLFMLVVILILGLILILGGANYLTDGSAAIARRFNVSGFVIGLTVVALGTSMPEMVVSIVSILKGSNDIAIGNVVGSNTFNTLMILGICALVKPIFLTHLNVFRDIPMGIITSAMLVVTAWSGVLSRVEGVIMLLLYIGMMGYTILRTKPSKEEIAEEEEISNSPQMAMWLACVMVIGGLGALIYGGSIFIDSAIKIAQIYNIPQNIIALTLVAGGTSLPEFAASLISLIKGKSDIALGNVIGSNIANILLVLGTGSVITPLALGGITMVDMFVVLGSSIFLFLTAFMLGRYKINRVEGGIMIVAYVSYMYYMVSNSAIL